MVLTDAPPGSFSTCFEEDTCSTGLMQAWEGVIKSLRSVIVCEAFNKENQTRKRDTYERTREGHGGDRVTQPQLTRSPIFLESGPHVKRCRKWRLARMVSADHDKYLSCTACTVFDYIA